MSKLVVFFCFLSGWLFANDAIQEFTPEQIECFYKKPAGEGPFPVIFLLHGFQYDNQNIGGKQLVDLGWVDRFVKEGIVAVSISIPGFGNSAGQRDYIGPDTQKAVMAAMDHVRLHPFIDRSKIGIYGVSRGAMLASMIGALYPDLTFQILESGTYDLLPLRPELPEYLQGIRENMKVEAGVTKEALMLRSAVYHTSQVKAETLILHGEFDDRHGLPSAIKLHKGLIKEGKGSHLKIFPGQLHGLSLEKFEVIMPFVRWHFFNLCGIGINFSKASPASQITKIWPGSPAELSSKLRVGDAILRISNDEKEIDVLNMPPHELSSLILGKKGTHFRLHVQHYDGTKEDVILVRTP